MKRSRKVLSFLTAAAMLGGVAVPAELGTVLTAQAYTDDTSDGLDSDSVTNPLRVPIDEASMVLEMTSVSLTLEELKAADYTVPVYVQFSRSEAIDAMQFGIMADERTEITVVNDPVESITSGYDIVRGGMAVNESSEVPGMYRFAWAASENKEISQPLVLLLVKLPEDAVEGDQFDISFLDREDTYPTFFRTLTDEGRVRLPFALVDGSIEICESDDPTEPETAEPETTEPETTEPETTEPETTEPDTTEPDTTEPTEPETTDPNPTEPAEPPLGDVSGDNVINAGDAAVTLSAAAAYGATGSYGDMTAAQIAAADIDGSGMVNASDAAYILQYAAMRGANGKDFDIRELVK